MVFADYGATVVKLQPAPVAAAAAVWDRNKLGLGGDSDVDVAALLDRADVLIGAPSGADGDRMDSDDIAARWPHLVHVRVSAFGADSPWPAAEPVAALVEARLGVMAEQDGPTPRPHYLGHPSTIYATAMLGVIGALAALRARRAIGRGQRVDTSLLDGVLAQSTMNWWWNERDISYLARSGPTSASVGAASSPTCSSAPTASGSSSTPAAPAASSGRSTSSASATTCARSRASRPWCRSTTHEYHAARVLAPAAFAARPRDEWLARVPRRRPRRRCRCCARPRCSTTTRSSTTGRSARSTTAIGRPAASGRPVHLVLALVRRRRCGPGPVGGGARQRGGGARPLTPAGGGATSGRRRRADARRAARRASASSTSAPTSPAPTGRKPALGPRGRRHQGRAARGRPDAAAARPVRGRPAGQAQPSPSTSSRRRACAVVHELAATADVVMHNFRPGKAEKLGIGADDLRARQPRPHLLLPARVRVERPEVRPQELRAAAVGLRRPLLRGRRRGQPAGAPGDGQRGLLQRPPRGRSPC